MANMFDIERIEEKQSFINYSLEEQYTGQKWIDGKKIYQKTLKIDKLPVHAVDLSSLNLATVIKIDGTFCDPVSNNIIPCLFFAISGRHDDVNIQILPSESGEMTLRIGTSSDKSMYTENYITLLYTRKEV